MITLQQSAGANNATIWVLKIHTATPIYISTKDIALDSTFDGQVLNRQNYLSEINQNSTVQSGGGTGSVSSYSFSISRYVGNASLSSFMDEFYPATSGVYLTSVIVDLGVCWTGATTDTEITWLFRGRVIDYSYEQRQLNLTVFQESEISNKEVPYYSVQKDFDNGVSYFLYAPEDSYGVSIPIVYGSFNGAYENENLEVGLYKLAPCIPVSKNKIGFIVASHPCKETSADTLSSGNWENVFKYIDGVQSYMRIYNSDAATNSTTYNTISCRFELSDNRGGFLKGILYIKLTEPSEMTDVANDTNVLDSDITTYSDLDADAGGDNKLALKTVGGASTSEVGILGPNDLDVRVSFRAATDGGGNRAYTMNYYNNTLGTPAGDATPSTGTLTSGTSSIQAHTFGTDTNGKRDATLPWTIEEVTGLDFYISNNQTTPGQKIRVYSAWITLLNIKVYGINYARSVRNSGNGRGA